MRARLSIAVGRVNKLQFILKFTDSNLDPLCKSLLDFSNNKKFLSKQTASFLIGSSNFIEAKIQVQLDKIPSLVSKKKSSAILARHL